MYSCSIYATCVLLNMCRLWDDCACVGCVQDSKKLDNMCILFSAHVLYISAYILHLIICEYTIYMQHARNWTLDACRCKHHFCEGFLI